MKRISLLLPALPLALASCGLTSSFSEDFGARTTAIDTTPPEKAAASTVTTSPPAPKTTTPLPKTNKTGFLMPDLAGSLPTQEETDGVSPQPIPIEEFTSDSTLIRPTE